MQNRLLRSIGRFFEGTGSVLGSPSGDARGHLNVPHRHMSDVTGSDRFKVGADLLSSIKSSVPIARFPHLATR